MSVKQHEAFCFDSFQDRLLFFDDFHGDQVQDEWRSVGATAVVDQQTGGIVRLTTGALTGNSSSMDWQDIRSLHVDQRVSMEARIKLNDITFVSANNGLRFDVNNRIFFDFRPVADANWLITCVDGGVGAGLDSGIIADTNYHIFRIESHTHGANHVHFYIDGTETGNSPINANIPDDATDYLQPRLYVETREDLAKTMDVDYVYLRQER